MEPRDLEQAIGAVLVPEVRVPGTFAGHEGCTPAEAYLHRFPPACVIAFGRRPSGARSPGDLLADLRRRCVALGVEPPIVACDLEQGAGLHFESGTRLPPAQALAAAARGHGDTGHGLNWIRSAGYVTGLEARELGVELVLAPVADVNTNHDNPIIAVRSFGDEPTAAAARARAFLDGLHTAGAGGCAKHYPGHGDTAQDSHVVLPRVDRDLDGLHAIELTPFAELVYSGVDAVMVGHLDVPALTRRAGLPTTLSERAVRDVLRGEMGFDGVVLSDAMNMGALERFERRYVRALEAGCDGLLSPHDAEAAALEILRAVRRGELDVERLREAAGRMHALRERLASRRPDLHATGLHPIVRSSPSPSGGVDARAVDFARTAAERALCSSGGAEDWKGAHEWAVRWAFPAAAEPSPETVRMLELAGWAPVEGAAARAAAATQASGCLLVVTAETVAGRGAPGLDPALQRDLAARIDGLVAEGVRVGLLWFASPQTLPRKWWERTDLPVLVAFAPTPPMVDAAHRFLRGEAAATGSLPVALG